MTSLYTGPTPFELACIPEALKARPQWVLWRGVDKVEEDTGEIKLNKVPYTTRRSKQAGWSTFASKASSTNTKTWGTFAAVVAALPAALAAWEHEAAADYRGGGLGFVFSPEDPFCGIDLDKCRNPETGELEPWATAIIAQVASYSETSPTGTGVHILAQGELPADDRKTAHVEMYTAGRYFTITGQHLPMTPTTIEARQDAITAVHAAHVARPPAAPPQPPRISLPLDLDDMAILVKAKAAQNGAKFAALWAGDTSRYGGDDSAADQALCCALAFWTRDASQIDRLFRGSELYRDKWERHDYRARTIAHALSTVATTYDPDAWRAAQTAAKKSRNGETPGAHPAAPALPDTRPVIRLGPDITRMVDEGQAALLALPHGPVLFQRARRLAIIARGVKPPQWLHRPADAPVICEAPAAYLDELATKAARWEKYDKRAKKGEEWVEVTPPSRFVQTLQARPAWPFPLLEGIIQSPTLRPDGSMLTQPGYDASTGLYLDFNGTTFPSLPASPTLDDARSALGRLVEVFQDFPFAIREPSAGTTNPYLSATLAAVLTLVGRPAIAGNVPLFGVTSTAPGSGKGLLVDTISRIGTGRYAPKMGQTLDDNEELKRLLALALEGASVCCLDNVTHPLGNQYLDMALTAQAITGRILGQTQTAEAPWNAVLFATGNNLSYRGDMTRRVVPIALDPKMEKPEERSGFTHPDLEAWVTKERPRLVTCALTILRAFFVAGRPAQGLTPYGSFQPWSDLVRTALVWLGEADPCEGRKDLAAQTDDAYEHLAALLTAWEACYALKADGTSPDKTINQVKQDIALYTVATGTEAKDAVPTTWDELREALAPFDRRFDGKSLNTLRVGNALRAIEGRVIGCKRLRRHGEYRHNALWRIEKV